MCAEGNPRACQMNKKSRLSINEEMLNHLKPETNFMRSSNRRWIMDIRIRSWNKKAERIVAHVVIASTEKSSHEQIKNQVHLHRLFDCRWIVHIELYTAEEDTVVNQMFYQDVLESLRKKVCASWQHFATKRVFSWEKNSYIPIQSGYGS